MLISELPCEILSRSPAETEAAGAALAGYFTARSVREGFLAMRGDLGAGKTAFTRGFVSVLCPDARVKSPTYTIVNEYRGSCSVHHFDTYSITGEDDLYSTGFFDMTDGFLVCEWSENIGYALPPHRFEITIERTETDENERRITVRELCAEGEST